MLYTYGLDYVDDCLDGLDVLYSLADLDGLDYLVLDTSGFHGRYFDMVNGL